MKIDINLPSQVSTHQFTESQPTGPVSSENNKDVLVPAAEQGTSWTEIVLYPLRVLFELIKRYLCCIDSEAKMRENVYHELKKFYDFGTDEYDANKICMKYQTLSPLAQEKIKERLEKEDKKGDVRDIIRSDWKVVELVLFNFIKENLPRYS